MSRHQTGLKNFEFLHVAMDGSDKFFIDLRFVINKGNRLLKATCHVHSCFIAHFFYDSRQRIFFLERRDDLPDSPMTKEQAEFMTIKCLLLCELDKKQNIEAGLITEENLSAPKPATTLADSTPAPEIVAALEQQREKDRREKRAKKTEEQKEKQKHTATIDSLLSRATAIDQQCDQQRLMRQKLITDVNTFFSRIKNPSSLTKNEKKESKKFQEANAVFEKHHSEIQAKFVLLLLDVKKNLNCSPLVLGHVKSDLEQKSKKWTEDWAALTFPTLPLIAPTVQCVQPTQNDERLDPSEFKAQTTDFNKHEIMTIHDDNFVTGSHYFRFFPEKLKKFELVGPVKIGEFVCEQTHPWASRVRGIRV